MTNHYYISVDQKVQMWLRVTYRVEAESEEEAVMKMKANKTWLSPTEGITPEGLPETEDITETDFESIKVG